MENKRSIPDIMIIKLTQKDVGSTIYLKVILQQLFELFNHILYITIIAKITILLLLCVLLYTSINR